MEKELTIEESRELLSEKYKFTATDGKIYCVKPAKMAELLDDISENSFNKLISAVGIPNIEKNARLQVAFILNNEKSRAALKELTFRYCEFDGKPVEIEKCNFTVDDIVLLIQRIAGISG